MDKEDDLNLVVRLLMGPGPSDVDPRVLRAMTTPVVGHLDPQFLAITDKLKEYNLKTEPYNWGDDLRYILVKWHKSRI